MQSNTPWNHNSHYHDFLLKQLPDSMERALDIGCGHGVFASRMAQTQIAARIDAMDVDAAVISEAKILHAHEKHLNFIVGDFLNMNFPESEYDVITALAAIHHMDFVRVLEKMKRLLKPGGVIIILGVYKESTILDFLYSAIAVPVNFFYRCYYWQRNIVSATDHEMAVKKPETGLQAIHVMAEQHLPGHKMQRHLLWRYSLVWRKPELH